MSKRQQIKDRRHSKKRPPKWYMIRFVFWLLVGILCVVMFLIGFFVGRFM